MKMTPKTTDTQAGAFDVARHREGRRPEGPCRPKPSLSIRVPLTPNKREYLRAMRAAELATWERTIELQTSPRATGNRLSLRAPLPVASPRDSKEARLYVVMVGISVFALSVGMWNSFQLVQKWQAFADFVTRWLG
jgi:hypothetical protein